MITVLVVEDDQSINDLLCLYLKNEGYTPLPFNNGLDAYNALEHNTIDCALLDVMLPGMDGFSLCTKIREKYIFPIIMLTAKGEDLDKIQGLAIGADDYMVKPFNPLEVMARIKSQLRRANLYSHTHQEEDTEQIDIRGLTINFRNHKVHLYGQLIELTPLEYNILAYLAKHKGQVIESEVLFANVWKQNYFNSNNTIMAHIKRLRDKLHEQPRNPKFIKTVWGVGYTIDE